MDSNFLEDTDDDPLEGINMSSRSASRLSDLSDGSSVLTERAASRASVCSSPSTFSCVRGHWSASLAPATSMSPIRTRTGEASELRLRCMLSEGEKYAIDPCAWKRAPRGTIQLISHRSGMVKFINDLRRDFALDSRVTWRAVSFMDRYVCSVSSTGGCEIERAELCAIVCLLLACKFQEVQFPSIPQLLEVISTTYTKQELKDAEVRASVAHTRSHMSTHALFLRVRIYTVGCTERAPVEPQLALAARRGGGDGQRLNRAPRGESHASCQVRAGSGRASSMGSRRCDILHR